MNDDDHDDDDGPLTDSPSADWELAPWQRERLWLSHLLKVPCQSYFFVSSTRQERKIQFIRIKVKTHVPTIPIKMLASNIQISPNVPFFTCFQTYNSTKLK